MSELPFDSVSVKRDGRLMRMTAQAFLDIPMAERVHIILERAVEFYANGQLLDRGQVLRKLRNAAIQR
jgi:hypothetical protein